MEQQTASVMHPRYQDFLGFMAYCPHRVSQGSLEVAFWVWLKTNETDEWFAARPDPRDEQIDTLKADLDRLHRERDSFQQQARVLAEEVERLTAIIGGAT